MTAKIQSLDASDIQTDTLAAALAAFTVITAGTATFDAATVQHAMNESGFTGMNGGAFQEASVRQLLHNEVYAGDTLLQKAYAEDPITKRKVKNKGELPQYYVENTHECCPYVSTMHTPEKPENRAFSKDQRMHIPVISVRKNWKTAPYPHERVCKPGAVFYFAQPVLCIW